MSLSRQYRPQRFSDITGQETIKETLRKEAATGKIGHAYLLSGPRGVGKTTTARIFAKALNCLQLKDGEPCTECDACREIQEGRALDVMEIDAASHTGVDNVREAIIEHVRFSPAGRKYKVYILDEAHMLSGSAWNALLKTLEEPPSYAVFILATTELQKVPATIISRCQRFDFKRIPREELAGRIGFLAKQEGITIAPSVVTSIVKHADGCVRDAETLLDQLMALGEKNITEEIAELVIPVSRIPRTAELFGVCADRSLGAALQMVGRLEEDGIPLLTIFDDAIQIIRMLLLASENAQMQASLERGDAGEQAVSKLTGRFTPSELGDMALLFMERRRDAKQGIDARFALELAVTAIAESILPHAPAGTGQTHRSAPTQADVGAQLIAPGPSVTPDSAIGTEGVMNHAPTTRAPEPQKPSGDLSLALVQRKWTQFVKTVREKNPSMSFILSTVRPDHVNGETVVLRFQYAFHRDKLLTELKNRGIIHEALELTLGMPCQLDGIIGTNDPSTPELKKEDVVSNILQVFGGQVVE